MLVIPLLLGWFSGWLVNYLMDVLPFTRKFSHPACPACQTKFRWADYLLFSSCTNCRKRRGLRTLIVQTVMAAAPVLIWIFPDPALPFPLAFILLIYLAVVLVIDLEHRVIMHPVSIVGFVLGLGVGILQRGQHSIPFGISSTLLGGAAGFAAMLVFYLGGKLYGKRISEESGLAANEVALGLGDVNLSGILGLLLGWRTIFACLLIAILAGGLVSLVITLGMLIARRYKANTAIPYAPLLILSAIYFLYLQR